MMSDLADFVEFDHHQRAAHGSRPVATELPFGMAGSESGPVTISLGDGRSLRLRGAVDRVDETHDGELIVIDYKTGSSRGYGNLSDEDPTPDGSHLQLVLYGLAVRQILERGHATTRGQYWFVTRKGGFTTAGYAITPEVETRALRVVGRIVDGIRAGHFPQHPALPRFRPWVDCDYCEPDGLGLSHQYRDWARIQADPDLAAYLEVNGSDRG